MDPDDMSDEYQRALDTLSSLISGRTRKDGTQWEHAFDMMATYLQRLDLETDLSRLSVIHVAGTKGKGSTCAMVESILRNAGYKTGLYTSPHLVDVRERIRIDGAPVKKDVFLKNLWETYETLKEKADDDSGKPAYFRFLTLLCFKIFLAQNVDVAILEVGLGGRLDATNCIRKPVVCGVTALGFDHMGVLGYTLPEIAREKAGIFKPGCPAFTVPQREDAMETLKSVAAEKKTDLKIVPDFNDYVFGSDAEDKFETSARNRESFDKNGNLLRASTLELGLAGDHQRQNASLAVYLAAEWEASSNKTHIEGNTNLLNPDKVRSGVLPKAYVEGLRSVRWPGRSQVVLDPIITGVESNIHPNPARLTYYLDGAHTAESMETCALWFSSVAVGDTSKDPQEENVQRVLLFNCMEEREPKSLLQPLAATLAKRHSMPHYALFVPPDSVYSQVGLPKNPIDIKTGVTGSNYENTSSQISQIKNDHVSDLSWQISARSAWENLTREYKMASPSFQLPKFPNGVVLGNLNTSGVVQNAVLPNLGTTIEWLRRCVHECPSLRLRVLITGSLYMVGDTLRLLNGRDNV